MNHTPNHVNCPACAEFEDVEHGARLDPNWPFDKAAQFWWESRRASLSARTHEDHRRRIAILGKFFGTMLLGQINIANIRAYQGQGRTRNAGNINQELGVLQQMLREAGCWTELSLVYKPLAQRQARTRKNMSEEEEERLVKAALDPNYPKQLVAGHCLILMMSTTAGFGELSHLRRCDVKLDSRFPCIEIGESVYGAKNARRVRSVNLNFAALRSAKWLCDRWEKIGGKNPTDFLLPLRGTSESRYNFSKPMQRIQRAAREILDRAGLNDFTIYDMRSHAITKLLSNPEVSAQVSREIAGHISQKMQDRYSVQRKENKQKALDYLTPASMMQQAGEVKLKRSLSGS